MIEMPRRDTMSFLFTFIGIIFIIAAVALAWHFFFGSANPPLPQEQLTIVGSTTPAMQSQSSSAPISSGSSAATSTIVSGENGPLPTEHLAIDKATFTVEVASTIMQKANGLSFRPSLAPDTGMLFLFGSSSIQTFWMKDMNFALDMIWIGGDTVLGFAENVPPPAPGTPIWSLRVYSSPDGTDKVLEVNAGTVAKYNIKVGDMIKVGN
jgi:uncharacterized membrane protein (UPF0127 family)